MKFSFRRHLSKINIHIIYAFSLIWTTSFSFIGHFSQRQPLNLDELLVALAKNKLEFYKYILVTEQMLDYKYLSHRITKRYKNIRLTN